MDGWGTEKESDREALAPSPSLLWKRLSSLPRNMKPESIPTPRALDPEYSRWWHFTMCRRFAEIGGSVCEVLITVAVVLVCSVAHSTIQLSEKASETETGCHCNAHEAQLFQRDELNAFRKILFNSTEGTMAQNAGRTMNIGHF